MSASGQNGSSTPTCNIVSHTRSAATQALLLIALSSPDRSDDQAVVVLLLSTSHRDVATTTACWRARQIVAALRHQQHGGVNGSDEGSRAATESPHQPAHYGLTAQDFMAGERQLVSLPLSSRQPRGRAPVNLLPPGADPPALAAQLVHHRALPWLLTAYFPLPPFQLLLEVVEC